MQPPANVRAPPPAATPIVYSRSTRSPTAKALDALEVEHEIHLERTLVLSSPHAVAASSRIFIECAMDAETQDAVSTKAVKVLGLPEEPPLQWLQRRNSRDGDIVDQRRRLPTKALTTLGTTIDDVRIEKALLVLGEAPGREIPAGKLPRPPLALEEDDAKITFAEPPPSPRAAASRMSVFMCAFLPWGVLAPLNIVKLQLNKVSPGAHLWVPAETELCQAACGVARMWATLFWSMQFANAIGCVYLHYHRERGLALLSTAHRLVVGTVLLKAYLGGVIYWPIGLAGALIEWGFAVAFARELRKSS